MSKIKNRNDMTIYEKLKRRLFPINPKDFYGKFVIIEAIASKLDADRHRRKIDKELAYNYKTNRKILIGRFLAFDEEEGEIIYFQEMWIGAALKKLPGNEKEKVYTWIEKSSNSKHGFVEYETKNSFPIETRVKYGAEPNIYLIADKTKIIKAKESNMLRVFEDMALFNPEKLENEKVIENTRPFF